METNFNLTDFEKDTKLRIGLLDRGNNNNFLENNSEKANNDINVIQKLINKCKIDLSEILAPPPVTMQIKNGNEQIALFTKGNFSIVTGAAKSRKTFLICMLMAAAIKGVFQDLFFSTSLGINLIFDTEQSRYKTQQIAKRICNLSGTNNPDNFIAYSLRTLDPSQRIDLIEKVLESTPNINFVAIDGIIDLEIDPILQADQAQRIISKLMKWSEIYNVHIVCVLHYNKTVATLLGHLGSFSHRKADAIISVTKSKDNENVSLVEPVDCREKEFLPFAFSIDEMGMPFIVEDYTFEKKVKEKKEPLKSKIKCITKDLDFTKHTEILNYVFKIQKEQGYADLYRSIKNAMEEVTKVTIGDNRAKEFIAYYLHEENIIKIEVPKKKAVYILGRQEDLHI